MEGFWPIFFLGVILKIPVGLLLYLVWWALHAETIPEETPPEPEDDHFRRFRRAPNHPRGPRRGPHGPEAAPLPRGRHDGRTRASSTPLATARRGSRETVEH